VNVVARLLAVAVVVALVLSALAALARQSALGSLPTLAVWFTEADGERCAAACILGVTPGETDFAAAQKLILAHPAARGWAADSTGGESMARLGDAGVEVWVGREPNGARVAWVYLLNVDLSLPPTRSEALIDGPGSLGEVLVLFGTPGALAVGEGIVTDLFFPAHRAQLSTLRRNMQDKTHLLLSDPLYAIYLYAPTTYTEVIGNIGPRLKAWHGLTHAQRYRNVRPVYLTP
jgi:hypothetical protein